MKCVICRHGETVSGTTTVTLERAACAVMIRSVPAQVCANCGESYVAEEIAARVLHQAEQAARAGAQVEIRQFAAA